MTVNDETETLFGVLFRHARELGASQWVLPANGEPGATNVILGANSCIQFSDVGANSYPQSTKTEG